MAVFCLVWWWMLGWWVWCVIVFSTVAAVSLFQGQLLVEVVVTVAPVSLLAVFGLLFLVKVSCWWW